VEIVRSRHRPWMKAVDEDRGQRLGIVGHSRAIASVIQRIERVAATRSTVLITGETGTGKELVARALHDLSAQRDMPFIKINCAAIPDTLLESELFGHVRGAFTGATAAKRGKFAMAHRGSIFLDEIGTLNGLLQAKLLRVLQEREVEPVGGERAERIDVRVISATNRNLGQMVDEGLFQDDLYYRLHVIPIELPPLRERVEDIPLLVTHFVDKHASRIGRSIEGVDEQAMADLTRHPWPGNIRELENVIERAVILSASSRITRDAIVLGDARGRAVGVPSLNLRQNVEWIERETIRRALELSAVKRQAARAMGITPRALAYYLNKYPTLNEQRRFIRAARISESEGESANSDDVTLPPGSDGGVPEMNNVVPIKTGAC
jgi:transcriptional regulator with PAS, ATPase and Fis domain